MSYNSAIEDLYLWAFSAADIIVSWSLNWGAKAGLLEGMPATRAYLDRMLARPHCPYSK